MSLAAWRSGALALASSLKETLVSSSWWLVPTIVASAYVNSLASLVISVVSTKVRERRAAVHRPRAIYLIRHGESLGNTGEEAYAHTPDPLIPLTELGVQQAEMLGRHLAEMLQGRKVYVYVSPYERARKTAEIAMRHLQPQVKKWTEDVRLREQEFAGGFQNQSYKLPKEERARFSRFFFRFPGGESGADVYDRVSLFLESLYRDFSSRNMSEDVVLIFSHGLLCRLFVMRWLHWRHEKFELTDNLPNCGMLVLERRPATGNRTKEYYELTNESVEILLRSHDVKDFDQILNRQATRALRMRGGSIVEFDENTTIPTETPPAVDLADAWRFADSQ